MLVLLSREQTKMIVPYTELDARSLRFSFQSATRYLQKIYCNYRITASFKNIQMAK